MGADRWQDPQFPDELRGMGLQVDVPPWVSAGCLRVSGPWVVRALMLEVLADCSPQPNVTRAHATFSTPSGLLVVAILSYPAHVLAAAVAAEARRHRDEEPAVWRELGVSASRVEQAAVASAVASAAGRLLGDGRFGQELPARVLAETTAAQLLVDAANVSVVQDGWQVAAAALADAVVADPQVLTVAAALDRDEQRVTVDRPVTADPAQGRGRL